MLENILFNQKCLRLLVQIVYSEEPKCNLKVQSQVKKRMFMNLVLQKKK